MAKRSSRATAAVVAAALALLGGGCGGDDGDGGSEIRAAFDAVRTAFAADDLDAACGLLSRAAVRAVGSIGHRTPTDCWADLATLADGMASVRAREPEPPRIAEVHVDGNRATAIAVMGRDSRTRLRFAREGGRWKLATLFGSGGGVQTSPAGPARPLSTASCGPVTVRGRTVRGGCATTATARDVDFTLLSALGSSAFARCGMRMDLHVDDRGRVWATNVAVAKDRFPCNDIGPCDGGGSGAGTWQGRVHGTADAPRIELDVCLDTCVGRFEGPARVPLVPAGRGWTMWVRGAVGLSGLELEGEWELARGGRAPAWPPPPGTWRGA